MKIKVTEFPLPTDIYFGSAPVGTNWSKTGGVIAGLILAVGVLLLFG